MVLVEIHRGLHGFLKETVYVCPCTVRHSVDEQENKNAKCEKERKARNVSMLAADVEKSKRVHNVPVVKLKRSPLYTTNSLFQMHTEIWPSLFPPLPEVHCYPLARSALQPSHVFIVGDEAPLALSDRVGK